MDSQCSSCGGFCKKSGCERQNVFEPKPVAWIYQNSNTDDKYLVWSKSTGGCNWQPLYTVPPQRDWQGLTDEEREELMDNYDVASPDYAIAIEVKLKEKNT